MTARREGRGAGSRRRRRTRADKPDPALTVSTAALGGRFQALSSHELATIDEAAISLLRDTGLSEAPEPVRDLFAAGGAQIRPDGRIRLPEAVVRQAIEAVPKAITLCGQNPAHDLHLKADRVCDSGASGSSSW